MTTSAEMARFAVNTSYDDLSPAVVEAIKKRILDSVGIAIGAIGEPPVEIVRDTVSEVSPGGQCGIWGSNDTASPPEATMMNTALVRYLDYMDSFLAPGETPHPSDNIAAAIVCGEYADKSGEDLLTAVGVAYEIQGALAWNAPVRNRGWDHVTHTVLSATAGAGKLLGLDREEMRNALGVAGTAHNALRVTRTGELSMWKGIASANAARNGVYSAMLAANGMEGPKALFEGQKGWKAVISGEFDAEYTDCKRVLDVMSKKYVAETYAQSAIEGLVELVDRESINPLNIEAIELETFAGAKLIIGGGEGDRHTVETKEQADHSLPYMLAVAALDGNVLNEQYEPERIEQPDVQSLLRTVTVEEDPTLTKRFEEGEMPAQLTVKTDEGVYRIEKADFEGHPNNPVSWPELESKFELMAESQYEPARREEIVTTIRELDDYDVTELVTLLD